MPAGIRPALPALRVPAAAVIVLGLAACASLPPMPVPERVHAGRFAATTTHADGRSENTTGRFTLAVGPERLVLDLATPLGTTMARIETGPEGAVLRAPGAGGMQEVRGRDAEALAEEVLGWPLPATGIGDWIVGRPAPGRPSRVEQIDGQVRSLAQDGWTIRIAERFDSGAPRRLVFARPAQPARGMAPPSPAITLRLVLDDGAPVAATH
jgi:outer membrane lipoprotein LolB